MRQLAEPAKPPTRLKRSLPLSLVVLYGLGVTIGAGIYVLIGVTAGRAGLYAPAAFVVAAVVMILSASSFAELSGRMPVSAGEAAYVRAGFGSNALSIVVGLMVVLAGSVSAAAISVGSAGYIQVFIDIPAPLLIPVIVVAMAAIAAVGIMESVLFAGVMTLIEVGGLMAIIFGGFTGEPELLARLPSLIPASLDSAVWSGIMSASLLAFFAFVGFEDLVNIAEEVKEPRKTMPRAIFLTLAIATALYILVAAIAVLSVPVDQLATSKAPLGLVFERVTNLSPAAISFIAIVATLNGIIVQMIMASRVIYGLADQGSLPRVFTQVSSVTRTPLLATASVAMLVLTLAIAFPLEGLAEMTSRVTLTIFAIVNLALLRLKVAEDAPPQGLFIVPKWVPLAGFVTCLALFAAG